MYCRWVCALYHYNQAVEFGAVSNFPSFDPLSGAITAYLLPPEKPARKIAGSRPDHYPTSTTIQETVSLPPLRVVRRVSPVELLEARNEYGPAYFTALSLWQNRPDASNEMKLRAALRTYSRELTRLVHKEQDFSEVLLEMVLGAASAPTRTVLAAALTVALLAASAKWPLLAPLIALGPLGYAVYLWTTQRVEGSPLELSAGSHATTILAEVNIPEAPPNAGTTR